MPTLELLKSIHTFPCNYTFKVIGRVQEGFVAKIVALVREELQSEEDPPFKYKETAQGSYISITLEPHIEKPEQILAIYSRVSQTDGVLMTM